MKLDGGAVKRPLSIWLISDGKPGHLNQSLGLVEAMERLRPVEVHRICIAGVSGWWKKYRAASEQAKDLPSPDIVMGAGHGTHFSLWRLARTYDAKSIVLMRPSMPLSWFDRVICPEHDFPNGCDRRNVLLTKGAINRVRPTAGERSARLILLGGPSKVHGWDEGAMLDRLKEVVAGEAWELGDSRRTPEGFLDRVRTELPEITVYPHGEVDSDWLPSKLAVAKEIWVTEDSISMVYESVTSGAKVGLLPVPRLRNDSRVLRGLDRLVDEAWVMGWDDWQAAGELRKSASRLMEADRCAASLLGDMDLA